MLAAAVLAAGYLPLMVHEFATGFAEFRAVSGATPGGYPVDLLSSLVSVPLNIVGFWLGLPAQVVRQTQLAVIAAVVILTATGAWFLSRGPSRERVAAVWLVGPLASGAGLLAVTLEVKGAYLPYLPVTYVTYFGPAVLGLFGLAAAALWRKGRLWRLTSILVVGTLAVWNLAFVGIPSVAYDGGWPAGQTAGARVAALVDGRPVAFIEA